MKNIFTKNIARGLLLSSILLVSGTALAEQQKPVEAADPQVDLTTTGSTETAKECLLIKSIDNTGKVCASADMFPPAGLSGLNLS